MHGQANVR